MERSLRALVQGSFLPAATIIPAFTPDLADVLVEDEASG
jgi:hypothetical protein